VVSYFNCGHRIANAQRAAGLNPTCSGLIGMLLMLVLGLGTLYYRIELNRVHDVYGQNTPAGTSVPLYTPDRGLTGSASLAVALVLDGSGGGRGIDLTGKGLHLRAPHEGKAFGGPCGLTVAQAFTTTPAKETATGWPRPCEAERVPGRCGRAALPHHRPFWLLSGDLGCSQVG